MTPNSTHHHCHSFNDGVLKCATNTYDISCNTYDETQVTADCIPIDNLYIHHDTGTHQKGKITEIYLFH